MFIQIHVIGNEGNQFEIYYSNSDDLNLESTLSNFNHVTTDTSTNPSHWSGDAFSAKRIVLSWTSSNAAVHEFECFGTD